MTAVAAALLLGSAVALAITGGPAPVPRWWPVLLLPLLVYVPGPLTASVSVLGTAGVGAYALIRRRRQRMERDAYAAGVRELCDALAADLAAGASTQAALTRLAERWPEVERVIEAERLGLDPAAAWTTLAHETGLQSLALVGVAWRYAQQTGIGVAVAMRHVADGLSLLARVDRTVTAELSSARATARLVALLPVGVLAMGSGLGGNPWVFLFLTTPGVVMLAAGLALIWLGLWWMESIVEGARR